MGHRRVYLLQFGFQMLIDQQQGFQRAADVAVATGYNLVDSGIIRFGKHLGSFNFAVGQTLGTQPTFLWIAWIGQVATASIERARNMAKLADHAYMRLPMTAI
jgi:hypothetical protein